MRRTFADAAGTGVGARLAVAALIVTSAIALATTVLMRILRTDPARPCPGAWLACAA